MASATQEKIDSLEVGEQYALNINERWGGPLIRVRVLEKNLPLTGMVSDFGVLVQDDREDHDEETYIIHVKWIGMKWSELVEMLTEHGRTQVHQKFMRQIERDFGNNPAKYFRWRNGRGSEYRPWSNVDKPKSVAGVISVYGANRPHNILVYPEDTIFTDGKPDREYLVSLPYAHGFRVQRVSRSGKTVYETFDILGHYVEEWNVDDETENYPHSAYRSFAVTSYDADGNPVLKEMTHDRFYRALRSEKPDLDALIEEEVDQRFNSQIGNIDKGYIREGLEAI